MPSLDPLEIGVTLTICFGETGLMGQLIMALKSTELLTNFVLVPGSTGRTSNRRILIHYYVFGEFKISI